MKLSGSKVRSKIWDSSMPSDDNIGLYFFPHGMRHDAYMDQLVSEVMDSDLVLRAVIDEAEMLIFPSSLLPERYKTFQRKHYLWGLFKPREDKFAVDAEPLNGTMWCAQEDKNGKEHISKQQNDIDSLELHQELILMKSVMPLVNQGLECSTRGGMDQSVYCLSPAEGTREVSAIRVPVTTNIGFQLKTAEERKNRDASHHTVHTTDVNTEPTITTTIQAGGTIGIHAGNRPANHGQINSSMGVLPDRVFCFSAKRTPILQQAIKELQLEGSLVFAMRPEAICAGLAANRPANHEQINSSMGVPPDRIICFTTGRTPRLEQVLQELQREGSLVSTMWTEAICAGPELGNITTTFQK